MEVSSLEQFLRNGGLGGAIDCFFVEDEAVSCHRCSEKSRLATVGAEEAASKETPLALSSQIRKERLRKLPLWDLVKRERRNNPVFMVNACLWVET